MSLIDDIADDFRWPADLTWHGQDPVPLAAAMEQAGVPAVSVATITDGEVSDAAACGLTCAGESMTATQDTLFQAASISKPVAAATALRLVADGRLDLDESIAGRLRCWQVPANDSWQPRLTIRQLLSHTAGLTVHGFPGYQPGVALPSLPDVLAGRGNTVAVRVASLPGLQFSYSGGGYCVLQQLLTDVTGLPFPELAAELVLGPAGLTSSSYAQPLPPGRQRLAAAGHRYGPVPVAGRWHVYPELAAAGLWTTPADLARFAVAVQRSLAGASGALLPAGLAELMITPAVPGAPCGLGLFCDGEGASRRFGHTGGNEGFICELAAYAAGGMGAVVMTNSDAGGPLALGVLAAIARAGGWPGYPAARPGPASPAAASLPDQAGRPGAAAADPGTEALAADDETAALAGDYAAGGVVIRIRKRAGRLTLQAGHQPPVGLFPAGPHRWEARELNLGIQLKQCAAGEPQPALILHQAAQYTTDTELIRRDPAA